MSKSISPYARAAFPSPSQSSARISFTIPSHRRLPMRSFAFLFEATEDEDDDGYSQASDDFEPDSEDEGPSQASHRSSHRQQHKARPQQAPPRGARLADSGSNDADTCGSGYYNDAAGMLGEGLEDSVMSTRCGQ